MGFLMRRSLWIKRFFDFILMSRGIPSRQKKRIITLKKGVQCSSLPVKSRSRGHGTSRTATRRSALQQQLHRPQYDFVPRAGHTNWTRLRRVKRVCLAAGQSITTSTPLHVCERVWTAIEERSKMASWGNRNFQNKASQQFSTGNSFLNTLQNRLYFKFRFEVKIFIGLVNEDKALFFSQLYFCITIELHTQDL